VSERDYTIRVAFETQERIELARSRAAAQRAGTLRVFTADGQEIEYDENDVPRPKVGD